MKYAIFDNIHIFAHFFLKNGFMFRNSRKLNGTRFRVRCTNFRTGGPIFGHPNQHETYLLFSIFFFRNQITFLCLSIKVML